MRTISHAETRQNPWASAMTAKPLTNLGARTASRLAGIAGIVKIEGFKSPFFPPNLTIPAIPASRLAVPVASSLRGFARSAPEAHLLQYRSACVQPERVKMMKNTAGQ